MRYLPFIPIALFALFAGLIGCNSAETESKPASAASLEFRNLVEMSDFTGDAACFDCHEDEYHGFYEHGMSNSMYLLTRDVAVEDFGSEVVVDSASGLRYETVEEESGYFMVEYLLDDEGRRVHELKRPMQYVIGSGTSARTYAAEQDGWFYELPVTWYTQQGKWDFSPGYSVANKRFDRKLADRCVVCHNSYPTAVEQTNGMYTEMPDGIGCERCHGPGSLHVDERLVSSEALGEYDDTIVNPAHLSLDLRLDVCQQCHLNGSVSLLRDGRTPYDFRPSESLPDYLTLFQATQSEDEDGISVISQADRMKLSACFLETRFSDNALECTTCHDPHSGFRDQGNEYFNATCVDCHGESSLQAISAAEVPPVHTPEANCIDCHMPRTDLIEAPHSAFTDHWIRVVGNEEAPEPLAAHESEELVAVFDRDREQDPESILYEGMAYVTRGYQEGQENLIRKGIDQLESAFENGHSMSEAWYLHGYANVLLGDYERAIESLEESVRMDPNKVERLNTLAQAYEGSGRDAVSIERLYREALRIQPLSADIRINLGRFLETQNRLDEAVDEYREVIRTESWNALGYYNLGTAFLRSGNLADARENLERSMSLDPFHGGSMSNLGLVLIQQGEGQAAREMLEMAIDRVPDHAESLDNLGTLYLNMELNEEAAVIFSRASQANPNSADVFAKLSLAQFRAEDYEGARSSAERSLALNPSQPLATQILQAL